MAKQQILIFYTYLPTVSDAKFSYNVEGKYIPLPAGMAIYFFLNFRIKRF